MAALFEIKLNSINVIENGKVEENISGVNALAISLILPREGVAAVSTVRSFMLKDKKVLDLKQVDIRKRFVMKELIKGSAILEVEITSIDSPSKFQKFLHKMFGVASDAAIDSIPVVGDVITGLIRTANDSFFQTIEPKDKITILGRGFMPLNEDFDKDELTIHLKVPKLVNLKSITINKDKDKVIKTISLKKDFVNGMVSFDIKRIE